VKTDIKRPARGSWLVSDVYSKSDAKHETAKDGCLFCFHRFIEPLLKIIASYNFYSFLFFFFIIMALPLALWKHLAADNITIVVDNARAPEHPQSSRNKSPPLIRAWPRSMSPPPCVAKLSKEESIDQPALVTIKLIDVYTTHGYRPRRAVSRPCRSSSSASAARILSEVLEKTMS
jgi:hypothetical protein